MKNNETLQNDVEDTIKWEPLLNAAEIGVTAKDGVITLTGVVDSYAKKLQAENAAKSVAGVKAIVEKIIIKFHSSYVIKDDNEIAAEILNSYKWNWEVPNDKIKVKVEKGWVTLEGELNWNYEKDAACDAVRNLLGVTGVSNNIKLKLESNDSVEKKDIENAFARNWALKDSGIHVKVSGPHVVLTGRVSSWYQKEQAERIAWNALGVGTVDNAIEVEYEFSLMD